MRYQYLTMKRAGDEEGVFGGQKRVKREGGFIDKNIKI